MVCPDKTISELVKCVLRPVGRQLRYIAEVGERVAHLNEAMRFLEAISQDVEAEIGGARRNDPTQQPTFEVQVWLESVLELKNKTRSSGGRKKGKREREFWRPRIIEMEETSRSSSRSPSLLPYDLALHIVSFLEARDVCSFACSARFWRDLCTLECVWTALYKRRWPSDDPGLLTSPQQGPRFAYITKHQKIAVSISAIIEFVKQVAQKGSLEVVYYLKAVNDLRTIELGFEDVQIFLLGNKTDVLLNLIGIHYCLFQLDIQPDDLMSVLQNSNLSERQVCVSWFKVGRWFYGFRLPDEHRSRTLSLRDLAVGKDDDVMRLLNRGAVHEVLRVHITSVTTSTR